LKELRGARLRLGCSSTMVFVMGDIYETVNKMMEFREKNVTAASTRGALLNSFYIFIFPF
jgi:hypothetical protein